MLGSSLLFYQRIGFSGTPGDLLPNELGDCAFEQMSDGKLLGFLTSPEVVTVELLPNDWQVSSVLKLVAEFSSKFHAFLDAGALITSMTNLQVAKYMLEKGLRRFDGVLFLNENDRKMIVSRDENVVELSYSGIPLYKRFVFYDQIHTTGTDISDVLEAKGILTRRRALRFLLSRFADGQTKYEFRHYFIFSSTND